MLGFSCLYRIIVTILIEIIACARLGKQAVFAVNSLFVRFPNKNALPFSPDSLLKITGQFADMPTRGQSSRGLVNWQTSQFTEMFGLKVGVYGRSV